MVGAELLDVLGDNWCITIVRSNSALSRDTVAARLGTVVADPVAWDRSFDRFLEVDWDRVPFEMYYLMGSIDPAGRTWVIVEPYGTEASRPEVQAGLSEGAKTFTLLVNENCSMYYIAEKGDLSVWADVILEEVGEDGDWLPPALVRLQRDSGVVLDLNWWNGQKWLVRSEPFPSVPAATKAPSSERLALIDAAVRIAADQVGMAQRPEVVAVLDAIEQINQLDASREEERISLVTQAQQSLQPLSCALWDAFTGGDQLAANGKPRPGAPPMEDDPLWHQMQYGLALEQALDLHARASGANEDELLLHLRGALPDTWQHIWPT